MKIGEQLKNQRLGKRPRVKQNELAKQLGVTAAHMCLLESGQSTPAIKTLFKWCDLLDCEIRILLK